MANVLTKWILAAAMSMIAAKDQFQRATGTGFHRGKTGNNKRPGRNPAASKLVRKAQETRIAISHGTGNQTSGIKNLRMRRKQYA